jgi:tetratricopeptide (TPR) repeat protein
MSYGTPFARPCGVYCGSCYTNLPDTATFCAKCGRDPRHAARPAAERPPLDNAAAPPAPAARRLVPVLAVGVALGLVGAAAALWLGRPPVPSADALPPGPADGPVPPAPELPVAVAFAESTPLPVPSGAGDLGPAAAVYRSAAGAYARGDYGAAAASLRAGLALVPDHPALIRALATTLEGEGTRALAASDFAAAARAFEEAVALAPDRGEAWRGLGFARLRLGSAQAAAADLREAARLLPEDGQVSFLLGTALYQAGDTQGAVEQLRRGRAAAGADPAYAALLEKVEREAGAEAGHGKAESRHFTVSFEGGGTSAQAGYLVSLLLEDAYHAVGSRLDYRPTEPVHAVLYPAEQFRDVTLSPSWAGAVYDGKIRIPVGGLTERTDLLDRTIRHEYTHALVHRLSQGRAPVWLNEGLAMLSEGDGRGDLARQFRAYVRQGGRATSLRGLEGSFMSLNAAQAQLAYAHALVATDYLVRTHGQAAARRVLDRLGEGVPLEAAIESTLYVRYDDLDRAWVASLR